MVQIVTHVNNDFFFSFCRNCLWCFVLGPRPGTVTWPLDNTFSGYLEFVLRAVGGNTDQCNVL